MHGRGACVVGGVCGGGHVWKGVCMVGGVHDRGVHGGGACVAGGRVWWGTVMAGETATAVDGTHPNGMHSCLVNSSGDSSHLIIHRCE